jgi:hypothetical protein
VSLIGALLASWATGCSVSCSEERNAIVLRQLAPAYVAGALSLFLVCAMPRGRMSRS